ncbi:MAG: hypothetical protein U0836_16050 [Pirellulales bacterium]
MYFDIDHTVTVATWPAEDVLARAASEIERRRGSVLGASPESLVFSAPFWRVNGPLSFLVPQLPFGVSQGVLDVVEKSADSAAIRCRVSFTWLRVLMAALLLLILNSAIAASARGSNWSWLLFLLGIAAALLIYGLALAGTRRFLDRKLFLSAK